MVTMPSDPIVAALQTIRGAAGQLSFGLTDVTRIVTAASELARNVFVYAGSGKMRWHRVERPNEVGLEIAFEDHGPGIPDVDQALQVGYSTAGSLGMGLPGAKRLMDELQLTTEMGFGTTVIVRKWRRR